MNDAEREALVEAMAEALWRQALGLSADYSCWRDDVSHLIDNDLRDYWREKARAALSVAEARIRADEREACAWQDAATAAWNRRVPPMDASASGWRDMDDKPAKPMPVLYWFGKRSWHKADGTSVALDPVLDHAERTEVGWWDGEEWCESGTGHDLFEPWREDRDKPTAWQPLPAAPEVAQ